MATTDTVRVISALVGCAPHELRAKLEQPLNRKLVEEFLKKHDLFLSFKFSSIPLKFKGLSYKTASREFAYNGFQGTTVMQHFYSKHRIIIEYPNVQCLIVPRGTSEVSKYPLELVRLVPNQKSFYEDLW